MGKLQKRYKEFTVICFVILSLYTYPHTCECVCIFPLNCLKVKYFNMLPQNEGIYLRDQNTVTRIREFNTDTMCCIDLFLQTLLSVTNQPSGVLYRILFFPDQGCCQPFSPHVYLSLLIGTARQPFLVLYDCIFEECKLYLFCRMSPFGFVECLLMVMFRNATGMQLHSSQSIISGGPGCHFIPLLVILTLVAWLRWVCQVSLV